MGLSFLTVYIDNLIKETITLCKKGEPTADMPEIPEPLCSRFERPEKATAKRAEKFSVFNYIHEGRGQLNTLRLRPFAINSCYL